MEKEIKRGKNAHMKSVDEVKNDVWHAMTSTRTAAISRQIYVRQLNLAQTF